MKEHKSEIDPLKDLLNSCKVSKNPEMMQAMTAMCSSILKDAKAPSEAASIILNSLGPLNFPEEQKLYLAQTVNNNINLPPDEAVDIIVKAVGQSIDQYVDNVGETIMTNGCVII